MNKDVSYQIEKYSSLASVTKDIIFILYNDENYRVIKDVLTNYRKFSGRVVVLIPTEEESADEHKLQCHQMSETIMSKDYEIIEKAKKLGDKNSFYLIDIDFQSSNSTGGYQEGSGVCIVVGENIPFIEGRTAPYLIQISGEGVFNPYSHNKELIDNISLEGVRVNPLLMSERDINLVVSGVKKRFAAKIATMMSNSSIIEGAIVNNSLEELPDEIYIKGFGVAKVMKVGIDSKKRPFILIQLEKVNGRLEVCTVEIAIDSDAIRAHNYNKGFINSSSTIAEYKVSINNGGLVDKVGSGKVKSNYEYVNEKQLGQKLIYLITSVLEDIY